MIQNNDEFANRFARGISKIERLHKRFMNRALAQEGITGIAFPYVVTIMKNPGISQDVLADSQGVDKSRVARIVRDLEDGGYITRELSPQNRRQYMVSLSENGVALYEMIQEKSKEWEALVCRNIDEKDLADAIDTLDRIIVNLSE